MALVETHLIGKNHDEWKSRVRKWGYRCSGQPALRTYRSDGGTSGGSLVAVSRSLASYGMGPLDNLEGFCCRPEARYWSGRTMRVAGRDVLLLAVYIPPGDLHAQARQDTYQDLSLIHI